MLKSGIFAAIIAGTIMVSGTSAQAAKCGNGAGGFNAWLKDFKREAVASGIPSRTVNSALKGVKYHSYVIKLDRSQKSFHYSFKKFYSIRVNNALINKGKRKMKKYARTFRAIEKRFGVPAPIITAIWGLETSYGGNSGRMKVIRSLATLAYDCRRSAFFTNELKAALKIIARGDMLPSKMVGAWAGEMGQTQFLASSYIKWGVSFDGNRRVDLIRSVPDVLASTANFLKVHGWKRGGGWNPGTHNFNVIKQWNRATVYQKTIAVMANKLSGR